MAVDRIDMQFAGVILVNEWEDFQRRHRDAIERRIYQVQKKKSTGTLRNARNYKVFTDSTAMTSTATLEHPDYERFIDMKKNLYGTRQAQKYYKQRGVLFRKKGIAIHNKIIWGKLTPLSFRLMHELRLIVTESVRQAFSSRTLPYNL